MMIEDTTGGSPGSTVGPLDRGLAILELFDADTEIVSVGMIANALGISKSSASRLAATLEAKRFLEVAEARGQFRLGTRLVQLAAYVRTGGSLLQVARPFEERLGKRTGETAHLGVLDGAYAVTIDYVEGHHQIRMHTRVGKHTIAYASSMGKAQLAGLAEADVRSIFTPWPHISLTENTHRDLDAVLKELADTRRNGFAVDREEVEIGMRCVAAPLFDEHSAVVGALSVSGPSARIEASLDSIVAALLEEAAGICEHLGSPISTYPPQR